MIHISIFFFLQKKLILHKMTHENVLTKTFMSTRRTGLLSSVAGQTFILTRRPVALRRQTNVHVGLPPHRPVILHRQKNVHVCLSSFSARPTFMLARWFVILRRQTNIHVGSPSFPSTDIPNNHSGLRL